MSSITKPSFKRFLTFSIFILCYLFIIADTQAQHQAPVVIDVYPGVGNSSNPSELTAVGDKLIFNATGSGIGKEPHISDGTSGGTSLLQDIFTGSNSANANYFTEFVIGPDTYAYYFANDNNNSGALYRTKVSDNTTEFVVNVNPLGSASSTPGAGKGEFLVNVNGTLFFAGQDPLGRQELFKSDGTPGGTVLVKDINTNPVGGFTIPSNPQNLTNIGGKLFFTADADFDGGGSDVNRELWVSDGTSGGTVMVKDINVGNTNSSNPSNLVEVNGECYFFADDGTGVTLWRSNGTDAGTFKVPLTGGATVDVAAGLVNANNLLFFTANDATHGNELWISDGTTAGVIDLNAGTNSSNPTNFVSVNGECFFSAAGATTGAELWKSNGTVSGTVLVKDIFPGTFGSSPGDMTAVRGLVSGSTTEILYFVALTGSEGRELWKSNGTDAGTVMVKDFNSDPLTGGGSSSGSKISGLTAVRVKTDKDGLALAAFDGDNTVGTELWFAEPCPTANITYASASLCKNAGSATVTLSSPEGADVTGGAYTATGGLPINASTGEITLNAGLADGAYTVTYKVTKGICDIETSTTVTLVPGGSSPSEKVNTLTNGFNFNTSFTFTSDGTSSMAISPDGLYLYVPDERNHVIKRVRISDGNTTIIAGSSGNSGLVDNDGAAARFNFPTGLTIDVSGTLYVADKDNHAIRKIVDPGGTATVSTVSGNGTLGNVIGTTAAARFHEPTDVEIDFSGNLYVADKNNHTIKKIDLNTNTVSILAGPAVGTPGFLGGAFDGASGIARFFYPTSIALDLSGNLYVADRHNNLIRRVLTSDGTTSTFAGDISQTTPGSTNGAAASARFDHPSGVTVDKEGNVYVADTRNHLIRKISGGNVTTLAGTGSAGSTDNNFALSVQFSAPTGIFADLEQNVYISDKSNQSIRRYYIDNPSGKVTTGQQVCAGSSGNLTLSGHGGGTITTWQSSSDGVNWTDIASSAGLTTLNYTNINANTFYRAMVQDGACAPEPSNYAVRLIAGPTAPVSGGDQTRCGAGTVTLTATGSSDGNYRWYATDVSMTSLGSNGSFTTPSLAVGSHTYYVAIAGVTCESSRVPVNITVNANPNPVVAGTNTICPSQTETYTTTSNAGSTYNWVITNPAIGTITSGQGTAAVTIEWGTTPASGTLTVAETNANNCTVTSPAMNITISPGAIDPTPAVTNVSRCGTGTVTLTAGGASSPQKYRWYDAAVGGTMLKESTDHNDADFTSPSISTTTEYYVSIINGTCEGGRIRMTATVLGSTPTDPTGVAVPSTVCQGVDPSFQASGASAGQVYKWYDAPTGGNLLKTSTDENDNTFTIGVPATVTYYVSISNTVCVGESNRVGVTATVTTTGGATPNVSDVSRCGTGTVNITASKSDGQPLGAGEEFRWYVSDTEPTAFETNTGSLLVTNLATTTSYYVSFFNGSCESNRVQVTATIATIASPTVIDGSRCDPGTVVLTANGATAGQRYFWYNAATNGTLIYPSTDENDNTYTTPSLSSNATLYVAIVNDNGTPTDFTDDCESARVAVNANINPPGTAPNAPTAVAIPTTRCGTGDFVLDASGATGGQVYEWYDNATATGPALKTSTDHLDTLYNATGITASTSIYVRILDASCGSSVSTLTQVDLTVAPPVADPGVTPGDNCGPGSIDLVASGGVDGQYRWYATASSTDVLGSNATYNTGNITATTTYYVSIFNGVCETNRVPVVATINTAPTAQISGTSSACNTQTVRYDAGSTGNTYTWTVTGGSVVSGGGTNSANNFVEVQWDAVATTGKITLVEAIGGCTSQAETNYSLKPIPTPALVGAAANCIAEQATYTTTLNAGHTYNWTVVGGTINGSTTFSAVDANSVTVMWDANVTAKSISVEEDNGACKVTTSANINPSPAITGPAMPCQSVAGTAYSTPLNAGNTYTWTVTGGTIDANGTNTITGVDINQIAVTWTNATTGSIALTETDPLACSGNANFNVTIITKPAAPALTGNLDICAFTDGANNEATYTITSPNASYTYQWTIVNASDGQVVSYTGADSSAITIRWSNNLPFSAADVANVKLQVAAKVNGSDCIGDVFEQDITVRRTPIKPQLTDAQDSVYVNTIRTYATTTNNAGSTYNWTVTGGTIQTGAGTNQITVKWGATATTGQVYVTEVVNNTGCTNNSDTATVNVYPYAITAGPLSNTLCEGGQVRLKATDANAVRFDWYDAPTGGTKVGESTNDGSATDTLRITQSAVGSFTYYATPITGSGVNGADDSGGDNTRIAAPFSVVVNDPANFTIVGDTTNAQNCVGESAGGGAVTLTTVSGGFSGAPYTYSWTKQGDGAYTATTKDITDLTPGTYTVQVTDAGGCTSNLIDFVIEDRRQFVTDARITPTGNNILVNAVGDTVTVTIGESVVLAGTATDAATFVWSSDTDADVANISDAAAGSPTMTPKQTTTYTLTLTNSKGCDTTLSIVARVLSYQVFIPTMFTPNNDNKNDRFQVFGNQVGELELKVFNREGKLVYESKDMNEFLGSNEFGIKTSETGTKGWDGTFENKPLPKGNYVWYLTGKFKNGVEIKKSGNVLLVR